MAEVRRVRRNEEEVPERNSNFVLVHRAKRASAGITLNSFPATFNAGPLPEMAISRANQYAEDHDILFPRHSLRHAVYPAPVALRI
jgi:hypothetical protein